MAEDPEIHIDAAPDTARLPVDPFPLEDQSRLLTFTFRRNVPISEQDGILKRIGRMSGVQLVARLKPTARRPELLRYAYLYLTDDGVARRVLDALMNIPEIEAAEEPATRQLL